jgi:hypothetical protein
VVALVALAVAAIIAVIGLVAVLHHTGSTTTGSGSVPTTSMIRPSSSDDWYAAVCRPGTFHNGSGHLHNADHGTASCLSPSGGPILMGEYSSAYMARNDAAFFSMGSSASLVADSGVTVLFIAPADYTGTALQPLAQYGFTITSSRG